MVDPGEQVSQTLKREFAEETLDGVEYKNAKLEEAFKHPVEVSNDVKIFFHKLYWNKYGHTLKTLKIKENS